jgi:hypothetical protein
MGISSPGKVSKNLVHPSSKEPPGSNIAFDGSKSHGLGAGTLSACVCYHIGGRGYEGSDRRFRDSEGPTSADEWQLAGAYPDVDSIRGHL